MSRKSKAAIYVFLTSLLLSASACSIIKLVSPTPKMLVIPTANIPTATTDHTRAETYLGDYIMQNGYFFAALEMQDPAAPVPGATVKPGTRLVAVKVIVGNQTGKRLLFGYSDVLLLDADGNSYYSTGGMLAGGMQVSIAYIDPGERVQGWISFFVPMDAQPAQLKYGVDLANKQYARLGLTPPLAGHTPLRVDTSRTPPKLTKLGEDAEGNGYLLRPLQVEDPPSSERTHASARADGFRLVAVELKVANIGKSVIHYDEFNINLVDTNGFVYAIEFFGREGRIPSGDIKPDSSLQGWVSFTIPSDARLESIKWVPNIFGDSLWAGLSK
jgi:hypothetical protein